LRAFGWEITLNDEVYNVLCRGDEP
jgi:hypothetical protein